MTVIFALSLLACDSEEDTVSLIEGTVETADYSATISSTTGFGFHIDGVGFFYFPSNPDATCDDVVAYLNHSQSSEPYDPTQVWLEGTCVLSLKLTSYDGGDYTFTDEQNWIDGFWNMNCAMGEGEFVYEESDAGYWDYYWSNHVWSGGAGIHTTTISEVEEVSYPVTVEISAWEGNYSDVVTGDQVPMDGTVSGAVEVEWCSDLYQTGLLGR